MAFQRRRVLGSVVLGLLAQRSQGLKDSLATWSLGAGDLEAHAEMVGFGFDKGGSYILDLELTSAAGFHSVDQFFAAHNGTDHSAPGVWAVVCTDDELEALLKLKAMACHTIDGLCSRRYRFEAATLRLAETSVWKGGFLTFVVTSCGLQRPELRGKVSYGLRTSDGGHLGFDLAPLPFVYLALVVLWLAVMVLWSANLVKYRYQNVLLQRFLTVVPCAKVAGVGLNCYYYGSGHLSGELPSAALYFFYIVYILFKGTFFTALLLIAKGWLITRPSLEESEKRRLFIVVMGFCTILPLYAFSSWFNTAYSLLALVAFHFYIRAFCRSCNPLLTALPQTAPLLGPDSWMDAWSD
jgi:hypothetical protein